MSLNTISICRPFTDHRQGGFIWYRFALISWVWTYYRLPETRNLSAGQLDLLFMQGVPARQFQSVEVDPFRSSEDGGGDEGLEKKAAEVEIAEQKEKV